MIKKGGVAFTRVAFIIYLIYESMKKLEEEKKQERQDLAAAILLGLCANGSIMKPEEVQLNLGKDVVRLSILMADEFLKQINEPNGQ